LLTGIYKRLFWIIEVEINNSDHTKNKPNRVKAYVITRNLAKEKGNCIENESKNNETIESNERKELVNETENEFEREKENVIVNSNLRNCSDFDVTVRDRNIVQIDQNTLEENSNYNIEFEGYNKEINDQAMLGHASLEYLKKLQTKHPEIKSLKECKFDESIKNCEVCLISKINKLPF